MSCVNIQTLQLHLQQMLWYVGEATEVVVVALLLVKSSPALLSKELVELVHVKQDEIQLLVKTVLWVAVWIVAIK